MDMKAETIAKYFLNKDTDGTLFSDKLIVINNHKSYEGNLRLNKYLHIAQNTYIAKYGELLFEDNMYAFDNGGVVENVRKQYSRIKATSSEYNENIPKDIKLFLDRIYEMLKNAAIEDLIQISHEDEEWVAKSKGNSKAEQKMDSISNVKRYQKQYADALYIMEELC